MRDPRKVGMEKWGQRTHSESRPDFQVGRREADGAKEVAVGQLVVWGTPLQASRGWE